MRTMPTCSPFGPTSRTSGTRIRSLMRGSTLMGPPTGLDKNDPPAVVRATGLACPDTRKAPHDVACRAPTARPDAVCTNVHTSPPTAGVQPAAADRTFRRGRRRGGRKPPLADITRERGTGRLFRLPGERRSPELSIQPEDRRVVSSRMRLTRIRRPRAPGVHPSRPRGSGGLERRQRACLGRACCRDVHDQHHQLCRLRDDCGHRLGRRTRRTRSPRPALQRRCRAAARAACPRRDQR